MRNIFPLSLAAILSCAAAAQTSADSYDASGFTVSPMIGMMDFDQEDAPLNDAILGTLAVGYQFNNPYAVELAYTVADTEVEGFGDIDIRQLQLDGLYHFRQGERLKPYGVFGVGQSDISTDAGDDDDEFVNIGAGFKYFTTNAWSIRTDLRAVRNFDADSTDLAFRFGLSYIFGAGKSTPKPAPVVVSLDDDNDGVENKFDQCPGTSAGTTVDANGCEIVIDNDTDKDGVVNAIDQCPNSTPGAKVNSDGCYVLEKRQETITLNVEFESNSDVVRSDEQNEISDLAAFMKKYSQTSVVLEGHTDSQGSAAYNQQLSQRRAQAIAEKLSNQFGIASSRIQAVGIGESNPVANNDTAAGRQKNRRVEAVVSAKEQ